MWSDDSACPQCGSMRAELEALRKSMGSPSIQIDGNAPSVADMFAVNTDSYSLLECFPFGISVYYAGTDEAKDLVLVYCNEQASKELGIDLKALIGQTMEQAFPAALETFEDEVSVVSYYITALKANQILTKALSFGDNKVRGSTFLMHFVPFSGRLVAAVYENITQKKQIEGELEDVTFHFRRTFEQAEIGIAHMTHSNVFTRVNEHLCDLLGYDKGDLLGQNLVKFLYPDDVEGYFSSVQGLLFKDRARTRGCCECRFFREDASVVWVSLTTSVLDDSAGQPVLTIFVVDISMRKRSELLIQHQMRELLQVNQELDDFTYIASHDLRSPLHGIGQLASWLKEDVGAILPEESLAHLDQLMQRTQRLEQMLLELLSFSRVGREDFGCSEVAMAPFLDDLVTLNQSVADGQFVFTISIEVEKVVLPEIPLRHVLHNLISNAIKHHNAPPGHIELSVKENRGSYLFMVADDGPGIPEKSQQRIFQIFQTLKARESGAGSGVGLAIVKKTLSHYKGEVLIDSTVGKGTTFTVVWPKQMLSQIVDRTQRDDFVG